MRLRANLMAGGLALAVAGSAWAASTPPDAVNLAYGADSRQVLDVWLAKSNSPAPLVVFFHGGGFTGGDKREVNRRFIKRCLDEGFSVASANYRFEKLPVPMQDGACAVQFLRSRAKELNFDPENVFLCGNSAGAVIAMWMGFHDDMADAGSTNRVAAESTRTRAVVCWGGQTCLDPHVLKEWAGGNTRFMGTVRGLFGARSDEELETPVMRKAIEESSPLQHLSKDDPPVLLWYSAPIELPEGGGMAIGGDWLHHPLLGIRLKERMDALGMKVEIHRASATSHQETVKFFKACLAGPP